MDNTVGEILISRKIHKQAEAHRRSYKFPFHFLTSSFCRQPDGFRFSLKELHNERLKLFLINLEITPFKFLKKSPSAV